ncbi:MAG: hypothetical protein LKE89_04700 [Lactobacillaceae bacterium]|nr:hypothetical protein [Lactobacillaceae bacterium]
MESDAILFQSFTKSLAILNLYSLKSILVTFHDSKPEMVSEPIPFYHLYR